MIKIFVSDVDGTMLNSKGVLEEEEIKAIKKLQENGVIFMLASGRNCYKANKVINPYGIYAPTICLNGANLYDENKNLLEIQYIEEKTIDSINELSYRTNTILAWHANEKIYSTFSRDEITKGFYHWQETKHGYQNSYGDLADCWFNVDLIPSIDYEFIKSEKPTKAEFIFCTAEAEELMMKELSAKYRLNMVCSGFANNLEITDIYATKGLMIRKYCKKYGIEDDEVVVIGDSNNDTSMFIEYPKLSYAMGNSLDSVKKQASFVTSSNDQHGFLEVAKEIMRINSIEQ